MVMGFLIIMLPPIQCACDRCITRERLNHRSSSPHCGTGSGSVAPVVRISGTFHAKVQKREESNCLWIRTSRLRVRSHCRLPFSTLLYRPAEAKSGGRQTLNGPWGKLPACHRHEHRRPEADATAAGSLQIAFLITAILLSMPPKKDDSCETPACNSICGPHVDGLSTQARRLRKFPGTRREKTARWRRDMRIRWRRV